MSKQWQVGQTLVQAPQPLQRIASCESSGSSKCVSIQSRTEAASISRLAATRSRAAARSSSASRPSVSASTSPEKRALLASTRARPLSVAGSYT